MRWVILALVLATEATIVVLLLQMLARWVWVWIRWPIWLGLIFLAFVAAGTVAEAWGRNAGSWNGKWDAAQDLLSFEALYPTYRLMSLSSLAGIPVWLLCLGVISLLRTKNGGLRMLVWSVSWKSSLVAFAAAIGLLAGALLVNDWRLCRGIRSLESQSRLLARRVAPPQCSQDQNSAPVFLDLAAFTEQLKERELPDPSDHLQVLRSDEWGEYLACNLDLADRIRAAAARPRCRFDIDWSDANPIADNPEFSILPLCLRLLYRQGERACFDGDIDLGLQNAVALRRIAEQLSEDPRFNSQILAHAAEWHAAKLIEHILFLHQPTPGEVARLVRPGFEFHKGLPAACVWQEAEHYRMLAMMYFGTVVKPEQQKRFGFRMIHSAVLARDRLLYAGDDLRAVPLEFTEIKRGSEVPYGSKSIPAAKPAYRPGGAKISRAMESPIAMLGTVCYRADMRRRLADFALQTAQRDLVGQMLAGAPDDIIPPANRPIDLFDDKPLRIMLADGGVVMYSVDLNGKDDASVDGYARDMTFCFGEAYRLRRLTPPKKGSDE